MANQSDILQPYKPQSFPDDPGSQARYIPNELQRVSIALRQIIQVLKQIDARLVAHGM